MIYRCRMLFFFLNVTPNAKSKLKWLLHILAAKINNSSASSLWEAYLSVAVATRKSQHLTLPPATKVLKNILEIKSNMNQNRKIIYLLFNCMINLIAMSYIR